MQCSGLLAAAFGIPIFTKGVIMDDFFDCARWIFDYFLVLKRSALWRSVFVSPHQYLFA